MPYGDGTRTISANVDSIASSTRSTARAAWAGVMLLGARLAQAQRHHNESIEELHHIQDQIDRGQRLADQRSAQLIATIEKGGDNQGHRDYSIWVGSTPEGNLYEYTYRPETEKRIRFIAALNEYWQREVSIAFATAVNRLTQAEQDLLLKGKPIYRDNEERPLPAPPHQGDKSTAKTVLTAVLYFTLFLISFFILITADVFLVSLTVYVGGGVSSGEESGVETASKVTVILCLILAVAVCLFVHWRLKKRQERKLQEYYNLRDQELARRKHIYDLNVAKLEELIDQVSRELGFDISEMDEVKAGWNSNSAVSRANSIAEFMENVHVTLPLARQWPPLPDKPLVADFSQTKLARANENIKSSVDGFDWRPLQDL
ncbi:hypothetical protein L3H35_08675 [Corynebacterium sp. MC-21]|uniref:hypothetical protein n=1 Tax=Corynebacterium parakroppenstedtii TaxID=2828363 RepID=UPI001EF15844|nr:hypothetical protein [Corynebacterium parakroppenstedtii]MCF6779701.1 hypothetical protein [Corynebacterium parakroppenstedtii]MCF6789861.1 hypothetical protein [Corynebacterium parakroppenstedtii]MDU3198551.1 hypothetical protein [Corynebacterium kroppenstedtii]